MAEDSPETGGFTGYEAEGPSAGAASVPGPPSSGAFGLHASLLGRGAEIARLSSAAETALQAPRVVTLVGEGGVGKRRLLHEFLGRLTDRRVFHGIAREVDPSYGVLARLLRERFSIREGADPHEAAGHLRRQVSEVLDDRKVGDVCYYLGQFMGLRYEPSPLTRAVSDNAGQVRDLQRVLVRSFFEEDASASPLCLVFEEIHLADEDSLSILKHLIANLSAPVLILCVTRPDLLVRHEDWFDLGSGHHERLEVGPVSDETAVAIMEELLARCSGGPPEALVEAGVNLAGGTPGLLHQMVRIFHDAGVLVGGADERWGVHLEQLSSVRLPLTVDDAVAARIAALSGGDRRLLEHAAAIGSVFWSGALVALGRTNLEPPTFWRSDQTADVSDIAQRLEDLVARDYLLEMPESVFPGEREFVFKHNLEREKVTSLTSAAALRRYHETVSDWLSQMEGVRSQEEYAAMLAGHLTKAGADAEAGRAYLRAGDLARDSYATSHAADHYESGLALLSRTDSRRRIDALHNHGDVLQALGRTEEALSAFREMLALAYRLDLKSKGAAAHNRIGRLYRDIGSLTQAQEHLETALELFVVSDDKRGIASCHDDIGKLLWIRGDYDHALEELRDALDRRQALGDRRSIALSLNNIGLVWMDHGQETNAQEAFEASLKIRREVGDALGVTQSLNNLGRLATRINDNEKALGLFQEAHEAAREIGERNRIAVVLTNIGETHDRLGDPEKAVEILTQAEELCDELGDRLHLAEVKRGLAKAYLKQNELRKARESIKHAVDLFGQIRSKVHLATALRTLGEVTGAGAWGEGYEVKAVDYFMRSIAICKEIGNELEVAKSYKAFSDYVFQSSHYKHNSDIQREAATLAEMATEIFERRRVSPAEQDR